MKNILLLLSILPTAVFSQHVLNSNEMLPFGAVMQERFILNMDMIDTTIQGPNQTWNFTNLQPDPQATDLFVTIVDPTNTPHAATFPTANYAYAEAPTVAYRYFNLTSTLMERVGSYFTSANTFSDPQVEYVFPLQLGTSNNDTWASTASSFGGAYNIKCIGDGQLYLPSGNYSDVVLVRVFVEETLYEMDVYFWYDASNGAILLEYIPGDGFWIGEQAFYLYSLGVSIEENDIFSNLKYTNPVRDEFRMAFHLKNNKKLSYTLVNSLGQLQAADDIVPNPETEFYYNIDFSNYRQGVYYLNIYSNTSNDKPYTLKLVKL